MFPRLNTPDSNDQLDALIELIIWIRCVEARKHPKAPKQQIEGQFGVSRGIALIGWSGKQIGARKAKRKRERGKILESVISTNPLTHCRFSSFFSICSFSPDIFLIWGGRISESDVKKCRFKLKDLFPFGHQLFFLCGVFKCSFFSFGPTHRRKIAIGYYFGNWLLV